MPLFTFYNFAVFSIPKIKHSSVSNSEILWENISLNWAQVLIFFFFFVFSNMTCGQVKRFRLMQGFWKYLWILSHSIKGVLHLLTQKTQKLACFVQALSQNDQQLFEK